MPYAAGARYDVGKGCLPGTREKVIAKIYDWINQDTDDTSRIFFLNDVAGAGKSAIAHEVARRFDSLKRLGSSYCFDGAHQAERSPDNVFSTIARDLADLDPERKASLLRVVGKQRSLRTTRVPREQFEKFILDPATGLTTVGPIVIVIDALDESGDPDSRKGLLAVLAEKAANLPSNFRILVTGRAEQDIYDALVGRQHVLSMCIEDIDPYSAEQDISLFIQTQLGNIAALERRWPNKAWCGLLVKKSEGLFQWASTACRFVRGDGRHGLDPVEQLGILLASASQITHLSRLDQLYLNILRQIFGGGDNNRIMHRFHSVMGCMLAVREPLSISTLEKLFSETESANAVELIVRPMGSLLSGVTQSCVPNRWLLTSFRDFLTDHRSGPFCIDVSLHHDGLAHSSIRIMMEELSFNICKLETSHLRNSDVFDLPGRTKMITSQLSCSCRFWPDHLRATTFTPILGGKVQEFLHTRLLFWLGVLSLIKQVTVAPTALVTAIEWSQVS